MAEVDAVTNVDALAAVFAKYAYPDEEGELATPVFMQETAEYASPVPHDADGWMVDSMVPLKNTLTVLAGYAQGHLSEQQLYHALGLEHNAIRAMIRITGVDWDDDAQSKLFTGELPAWGGDGETITGTASEAPKAIGQF